VATKLSQVAHFDCDVSDKQHSELLGLVWSINKEVRVSMSYDLKKVDNSPLRDVWYQDVVEHFGV
jgi:phosphate-selective porin